MCLNRLARWVLSNSHPWLQKKNAASKQTTNKPKPMRLQHHRVDLALHHPQPQSDLRRASQLPSWEGSWLWPLVWAPASEATLPQGHIRSIQFVLFQTQLRLNFLNHEKRNDKWENPRSLHLLDLLLGLTLHQMLPTNDLPRNTHYNHVYRNNEW